MKTTEELENVLKYLYSKEIENFRKRIQQARNIEYVREIIKNYVLEKNKFIDANMENPIVKKLIHSYYIGEDIFEVIKDINYFEPIFGYLEQEGIIKYNYSEDEDEETDLRLITPLIPPTIINQYKFDKSVKSDIKLLIRILINKKTKDELEKLEFMSEAQIGNLKIKLNDKHFDEFQIKDNKATSHSQQMILLQHLGVIDFLSNTKNLSNENIAKILSLILNKDEQNTRSYITYREMEEKNIPSSCKKYFLYTSKNIEFSNAHLRKVGLLN